MRIARAAGLAFGLGATMMCLELVAVRLMAPHFGDSALVWTNVIGVMLVALAAGAFLGGRWAERADAARRLRTALFVAAAAAVLVPLLAAPLGGWLVPQDLPLEAAMGALVRGSFLATLLLFAPPVLFLGCASPILVAELARAGVAVGRASGAVNAAGTLGSLVGTFAATHVLVPGIGSRATVWLCAAAIAVCAAAVGARRAGAGVVVASLLLAMSVRGPLRPPLGGELLAERETAQQYLQVVRDSSDGVVTTSLKINEGLDSFHSLAIAGTAWTNGAYYDWHAVAPIFARDGGVPDGAGLKILSLGAAANTFARLFAAAYPGCVVDGVELDPAATALGDAHFGGRQAAGRDYLGLDARVFVERAPAGSYDVVLVDCYAKQIYVPAHVASREFFTAVARCLKPGGVVSVNSGGWSFDDPVVQALSATLCAVFGGGLGFAVPWSRNYVLLARKDGVLDAAVLEIARPRHAELRDLLSKMSGPGRWRTLSDQGPVLSDDRPLLDALQHTAMSLAHAGRDPALTVAAGPIEPAEAGEQARTELVAGRANGCLERVRQAREVTPYLRLLAGDARWSLGDLRGAQAEFAAAMSVPLDDALRVPLQGRTERIAAQVGALDRAAATAQRNGVLAMASALVAVLAVGYAMWPRRSVTAA